MEEQKNIGCCNPKGSGVIQIELMRILINAEQPITVAGIRNALMEDKLPVSTKFVHVTLANIRNANLKIQKSYVRVGKNKKVPAYQMPIQLFIKSILKQDGAIQ
ncbi:MAG: hypothetical protein EBX41_00765 [Chitinophagia bacterium]|nr:hypothetical protein [Chitinophagia bacterium]